MPAGFFEGRPERNLFGRLMAELIWIALRGDGDG